MFETITNSPLFSTIALTLIHFLWQGLAVAVILKSALMITPKQHSRLRYFFSSVAMLVNLILPLLTFAILYQPEHLIASSQGEISSNHLMGLSLLAKDSSMNADILVALPYLTVAWIITILGLSGKLIYQMISVNQLPKHQSPLPYTALNNRFNELVNMIGIRKAPQLIVSLSVKVPMAIGWLKPVVLLPVSMVTGLTSAQLDMLLLHELAHIRRHDYFVNLIQSIVEIILFFHPAVFWVSKQMRVEREYCSDDIAVKHCGDALAYAHTLTDTASLCNKHRHAIPTMAMAASGGDLKGRVLRLVNHHSCTSTYDKSKWLASVIIVGAFLILTSHELSQLNYLDITSNSNSAPHSIESSKVRINADLPLKNRTAAVSVVAEDSITEKNSQINNHQKSNNATAQQQFLNDTPAKKVTGKDVTLVKTNQVNEVVKERVKPVISFEPSSTNLVKENDITKPIAKVTTSPIKIETLTSPAKVIPPQKMKTTVTTNKIALENETITNKNASLTTSIQSNDVLNAVKNKPNFINPYAQEIKALSEPPQQTDILNNFEQKSTVPTQLSKGIAAIEVTPEVIFTPATTINMVDPKYPSWAQRKKIELDLRVNFTIDENGQVQNIQIEERSKASYFKSSIIKAMKQWQFSPAKENGLPVKSKMTKIFAFNLNTNR